MNVFYLANAFLKFPGIQPKNQNAFANFRLLLTFLVFSLVATLSVVEVVITYKTIETLGKADIFPVYIKNLITIIFYLSSKEKWKKVLQDIDEKFWDLNEIARYDRKFLAEQKKTSTKILNLVKYYLVGMFATAIIFFVKPLFYHELPFTVYTFCDTSEFNCYIAVYLCECATNFFNASFVLGFDLILIHQVLSVYTELEVVKYCLGRIDCEDNEVFVEREVNRIVEHHGVVLDVVDGLRKIWSEILLLLYWMSTLSLCLGLFLMTINGIPPDMASLTKYGAFVSAFAVELAIYCVAGTVLMEQSTSVSRAAFEVNWWVKTQPNIRRALTMMIQRANKPGILDIGGIIPICLFVFPQILRTSFSFFTLMNNLKEAE